MTKNQILYQELQQKKWRDQQDVDLAQKNLAELSRHNTTVEAETGRHNLIVEGQAYSQLTLNERGVAAQEKNAEVNMMNAETNRQAVEVNRYNAETNRLNYSVNLMNAETNKKNAESNRISALAAQSQAGAAWANAQTNARMADISAQRAAADIAYNRGMLTVAQQNAATNRMNANTNARMAESTMSLNAAKETQMGYENLYTQQKTKTEEWNTRKTAGLFFGEAIATGGATAGIEIGNYSSDTIRQMWDSTHYQVGTSTSTTHNTKGVVMGGHGGSIQ